MDIKQFFDKDEFWTDYDRVPIGEPNPYCMCSGCELSDPEINGNPLNHGAGCPEVLKEVGRRAMEKAQ